jgi:hypothetical protein
VLLGLAFTLRFGRRLRQFTPVLFLGLSQFSVVLLLGLLKFARVLL